jgi:hypothetical protein
MSRDMNGGVREMVIPSYKPSWNTGLFSFGLCRFPRPPSSIQIKYKIIIIIIIIIILSGNLHKA